jgi:type II secretory pathway pseudopilin PulG
MYLAGQGETARRRNDAGYAMAALIVGLAVMAVVMTAAMPVWKHMAQREKEEELVFRGEQYAHAIGMFQRRTANAYPPNLDVLVQQKFLRKKYKDPITDGDFVPLSQGQQNGQRGNQPGQQGAGQQGRGQQPAPGAPGTAAPGQTNVVGGIIGVTSKSADESIRLYKGRSHYNEWAFVYTPPALTAGAGGQGGTATPGNPARGGGPPGRGAPQGNQPPIPGGGFPGRRGQGGPPNPARGNLPNPFPGGPGRGR